MDMAGTESALQAKNINLSASSGQLKGALDKKRQFDRRVLILKQEYDLLNKKKRPGIMKDDLQEFLLETGFIPGKVAPDSIFEMLDENSDGMITKNEYIKQCFEIEDIILEKINGKVSEINKLKTQYEEIKKKLMEAKNTERTNRHGIMEGSVLRLGVVEAKELESREYQGKLNPYVLITVGSQHRSTKYLNSTLNPFWNEEICFDIFTGEEPVKMSIMNKDIIRSDEFKGMCEMELSSFTDQLKHDMWVDLTDMEGQPISGSLHLMVQFIHSNITYYADFLTKIADNIRLLEGEKNELEEDLAHFREPHGIITYIDTVQVHRESYVKEEFPIAPLINPSVAFMHRETSLIGSPQDLVNLDNLLWIALMICALFTTAYRPDFYNLCVSLFGFSSATFYTQRSRATFSQIFVYALGFTVVYDCLWLLFYGYQHLFSLYLPKIIALLLYIGGAVLKVTLFFSYRRHVVDNPLLTTPSSNIGMNEEKKSFR